MNAAANTSTCLRRRPCPGCGARQHWAGLAGRSAAPPGTHRHLAAGGASLTPPREPFSLECHALPVRLSCTHTHARTNENEVLTTATPPLREHAASWVR